MQLIPNGTQTVDRVFAQIALTAIKPDHADALKYSCHQQTATAIRQGLRSGLVHPTDTVLLLGIGKTVYHSIITHGSDIIFDTDAGGVYDHQNQIYNASDWKNSHFKDDIHVLDSRTIDDIIQPMAVRLLKTTMAQSPCNSVDRHRPFARYVR